MFLHPPETKQTVELLEVDQSGAHYFLLFFSRLQQYNVQEMFCRMVKMVVLFTRTKNRVNDLFPFLRRWWQASALTTLWKSNTDIDISPVSVGSSLSSSPFLSADCSSRFQALLTESQFCIPKLIYVLNSQPKTRS